MYFNLMAVIAEFLHCTNDKKNLGIGQRIMNSSFSHSLITYNHCFTGYHRRICSGAFTQWCHYLLLQNIVCNLCRDPNSSPQSYSLKSTIIHVLWNI